MCRMTGVVFRSSFPTEALMALKQMAETGRIPDEEPRGHRDGWGMASFVNGSPKLVGRSIRPAHLDPSFDSAMADAMKLAAPNVLIAHVRAASRGGVAMENTHPFIADGIVLAHNGTFKDFDPKTRSNPKGQTDSERLLMLLMDRCEDGRDLHAALKSVITEDLRSVETRGAVLLVSDGSKLYGYRKVNDPKREWYYKLHVAEAADAVMLYQEVPEGCALSGRVSEVGDGELVSVSLDLKVVRERLV